MDPITIWPLLGFIFAAYAVTANDSIQTLGTYISSNRDVKWYWMFAFMGSIFVATMMYGFSVGDPAFGRLDKFPHLEVQWYHALAPLALAFLTRFKIPVSTTFLVLSVFASSVVMEKMLVKSFLGYGVSFIFAFAAWYLLNKYVLQEGEKGDDSNNNYWRAAQWITTGWLWSTWLKHDMANIMVFLPRYETVVGDSTYHVLVIGVMLVGLAFMFWQRGGQIQDIVLSKTNTRYVRSATMIDLLYCFVLYFFKELNSIPMSTTFVFMGMLAGRELGLWFGSGQKSLTYTSEHKKAVFPMLCVDFLRLMLGLAVSVTLAYAVFYLK